VVCGLIFFKFLWILLFDPFLNKLRFEFDLKLDGLISYCIRS
jgi:hypothetical protein